MKKEVKPVAPKEAKLSYKHQSLLSLPNGSGYVRYLKVTHPTDKVAAKALLEELDTFVRHEYPKQFLKALEENSDCTVSITFTGGNKIVYADQQWSS